MSSAAFRYWMICRTCGRKWMHSTTTITDYMERELYDCEQCRQKREDPPKAEAQSGSNT